MIPSDRSCQCRFSQVLGADGMPPEFDISITLSDAALGSSAARFRSPFSSANSREPDDFDLELKYLDASGANPSAIAIDPADQAMAAVGSGFFGITCSNTCAVGVGGGNTCAATCSNTCAVGVGGGNTCGVTCSATCQFIATCSNTCSTAVGGGGSTCAATCSNTCAIGIGGGNTCAATCSHTCQFIATCAQGCLISNGPLCTGSICNVTVQLTTKVITAAFNCQAGGGGGGAGGNGTPQN